MQCPFCHAENRDDAHFCVQCGEKLEQGCPSCGIVVEPGWKFCGGCGAQLSQTDPAEDAASGHAEIQSDRGAERRQLTVMFCDLVGSTALSQRLDPEDLREVNRAYQDACNVAIERYEGYVARYMGDGVLAYFGYPQAHEDDAERAIHAGLGIVESISRLDTNGQDIELEVRVGIATGPVVVGDLIGEGASQESAAVGETPNLAARLQGLAEKGTVVISVGTHELTGSRFTCDDLGLQVLKGMTEPVRAWHVIAPAVVESRFEARHTSGLTPLVGREHEIGLVLGRWSQAKEGDGQVVLLSGEAGIGKSRIIEALRERIAADHPVHQRYQCSPYHTNSALYPVIEHLERTAQFVSADTTAEKLHKLETLLGVPAGSPAVSLFAAVLSIPVEELYLSTEMGSERQRQATLDALVSRVVSAANDNPVILIFEDAHWADPTSLDWLGLIIERIQLLPVLVLITFRPEFTSPWTNHTHVTSLTLNRFPRRLALEMMLQIAGGRSLPEEVQQEIIEKTDGIPLFVEELTKTILESGLLTEESDQYVVSGSLADVSVPSTLHDSLMARLDRLTDGKQVAQAASAIGREFSRELLGAVCMLESAELHRALDELVDSGLVHRRGGEPNSFYIFKHALVQEAAYESLLRTRRRSLHQAIAEALLTLHPETSSSQPELIAHHYTEANLRETSITYWIAAGRRAAELSADHEAVSHLTTALAALLELPDSTERARRELEIQLALCTPFMATTGWGSKETARTYERARELCTLLDESEKLRPVLYGEYMRDISVAKYESARSAATQLLLLGEQQQDSAAVLQGHRLLGWNALYLGEFDVSKEHVDQALQLYDAEHHGGLTFEYAHDAKVAALSVQALLQSLCGYLDQARKTTNEAVEYAREVEHKSTLAYGLMFAGALPAVLMRNESKSGEYAKELLSLSEEQDNAFWRGFGLVIAGWSKGKTGATWNGVKLLSKGLESLKSTAPNPWRPLFLALLADVYICHGNASKALCLAEEALTLVQGTGERMYEAEIQRLNAEALPANFPGKEESFRRAMEVAQAQGAKLLELRAASSLANMCNEEGRRDEGRDLLAPILDWFGEGFDTPDFKEAKALLAQLS